MRNRAYRILSKMIFWSPMNKLFSSLFFLAFIACDSLAGSATGQVTYLNTKSNGHIFFYLTVRGNDRPECQNPVNNYWFIDTTSEKVADRMFAQTMAALASGKRIKVTGTGKCDVWSDGETVKQINLIAD